jgi:hypothetical protein
MAPMLYIITDISRIGIGDNQHEHGLIHPQNETKGKGKLG